MIFERLYGTATTIQVPLIAFSTTSFHTSITSTVFAAGDTKISLNNAGFTNTATTPTGDASNFTMVLSLTAAELSASRISVRIVDQTAAKVWEDQMVILETYGTTTAQHAFNRNQTAVQASLTANNAVVVSSITSTAFPFSASLTAAQTGVTIATVTDITNGVKITATSFPLQASLTANNAVVVSSITTTAFPFAASLTAAQAGVTIATVTQVTNQVVASLTANQAGVTIATVTDLTNDTDVATAIFAATITSTTYNVDTVGRRLTFLDQAVSSVTAAINSTDVANAVWSAHPTSFTTIDTFGDMLDATISGVSVAGAADWTANERRYIRGALGVPGSTTAGSSGIIGSISAAVSSISAAVSSISAAIPSISAAVSSMSTAWASMTTKLNSISAGVNSMSTAWASNTTLLNSIASAVASMSSAWASNTTILNSISAAVSSVSAAMTSRLDAAITTRSSHSQTDVATAIFTATVTSTSFNADTVGERITAIDNKLPTNSISGFDPAATGVTLTASQAGVTIATVTQVTNQVIASLTAAQAGVTLETVSNLGASATAQVNAEVVDVVNVDTISELGIAAPPATPTMRQAAMMNYMAIRNKITVSATNKAFTNDAGATICSKAISDDGATYTENEAS